MRTLSRGQRALAGSLLAVIALAAGLAIVPGPGADAATEPERDPAVERTREQVQMLDDLYKTAVVSITNIYEDGPPAVRVAHKLFGAMDQKGWHSAKLVDASGSPMNEANLPKTDFEKRASEAIQAGKEYYEEIVGEGDDRRLLAATVVPAVLQRCADCHGTIQGELLGFIRYDIPIK